MLTFYSSSKRGKGVSPYQLTQKKGGARGSNVMVPILIKNGAKAQKTVQKKKKGESFAVFFAQKGEKKEECPVGMTEGGATELPKLARHCKKKTQA